MVKVIGLISGTSVDGIDAVVAEIGGTGLELQVDLLAGETYSYPEALRQEILAVCGGAELSMEKLAELDDAIALQFALAAEKIARSHPQAQLIGSHGQTLFHRPPTPSRLGYSLQMGRGDLISQITGLPTVSNFRAADIAAGGHGAPLVPKIDACLFADPQKRRCVQNIGGISNLTYLPPKIEENWLTQVWGWDTGPGNAILDAAVQQLTDNRQTYDKNGSWAAQGTPCQDLIHQWLQQDFFQLSPPKSTGRELFSPRYLQQCCLDAQPYHLSDADWLATLTELTVAAIVHSYRTFLPAMPDEVILCGGGSRNLYLTQRLQIHLDPIGVFTTDDLGISSDFKEALAFAVLAYWRYYDETTGNLPTVTGAARSRLLGDIHSP
jgi:anhydro-N-acetylmuramic acid kinase